MAPLLPCLLASACKLQWHRTCLRSPTTSHHIQCSQRPNMTLNLSDHKCRPALLATMPVAMAQQSLRKRIRQKYRLHAMPHPQPGGRNKSFLPSTSLKAPNTHLRTTTSRNSIALAHPLALLWLRHLFPPSKTPLNVVRAYATQPQLRCTIRIVVCLNPKLFQYARVSQIPGNALLEGALVHPLDLPQLLGQLLSSTPRLSLRTSLHVALKLSSKIQSLSGANPIRAMTGSTKRRKNVEPTEIPRFMEMMKSTAQKHMQLKKRMQGAEPTEIPRYMQMTKSKLPG